MRAETLSIYTDWPNTWRLAKLRGLESELSSFLFRLLHHLLPTQERVLRLKGDGGKCLLCNGLEDLVHAFFSCPHSSRAGLALLGWVQVADGELLPEDALTLNLSNDLSPDAELAAVVAKGRKPAALQERAQGRRMGWSHLPPEPRYLVHGRMTQHLPH